ncbi:MAG: MDR family MFS transporter [Nocardioidaceae bacterium]
MSATDTAPHRSVPQGADGGFTHRQIMTILSGLLLGMFLAALDQTVVGTAIRTISDDLHGFDLQVWATTAFLITSTISTPLYGKLSDMYGRRPFYLLAITIFLAGSMLCGLSQSMYELAGFRALQGLGAGGLMSLALAIMGDIVPPRERTRYQGLFMGVWGMSSVLGPVIGGFFAGASTIFFVSGWRWIFYINVPLGLFALFVVARVLHIPHTKRDHRVDWPGALALVLCLVPLLTVAEQGRTWGWSSGPALACYLIGLAALGAFLWAERRYGDEALLPLRLFRNRSFSISSASSFIIGSGMFGAIVLLPLYLQVVKGSSPTVAGLQTLPLMFGIMAGAMGSGQIISKTGRYKKFPVIGSGLMVVALLLFHSVGADTPLWQTMAVMALFGVGLGFNMQPVILAVQNSVKPTEMGVATSSVTFFRQMGGTMGAAVFFSVLFTTAGGKIASAYEAARHTKPFQAAAAANPDQLHSLSGAGSSLTDTSFLNHMNSVLSHPFKVGFSQSMDVNFLLAACIIALGFLVVLFLPDLPLRNMSGVQAAAQEARERLEASQAAEQQAAPQSLPAQLGSLRSPEGQPAPEPA